MTLTDLDAAMDAHAKKHKGMKEDAVRGVCGLPLRTWQYAVRARRPLCWLTASALLRAAATVAGIHILTHPMPGGGTVIYADELGQKALLARPLSTNTTNL